MQRRQFMHAFSTATGAALLAAHAPGWAQGAAQRASSVADRILILVELKGGNDGLNTVVPFADPAYAQLRPVIGLKADEVLRLDAKTGLHPALKPLLGLWGKASSGSCRAWAIRSQTCRTFGRSKFGKQPPGQPSTWLTAGPRAA